MDDLRNHVGQGEAVVGEVLVAGVAGFAALPAAPTFLAEVAAMSLLAAGLSARFWGRGPATSRA